MTGYRPKTPPPAFDPHDARWLVITVQARAWRDNAIALCAGDQRWQRMAQGGRRSIALPPGAARTSLLATIARLGLYAVVLPIEERS